MTWNDIYQSDEDIQNSHHALASLWVKKAMIKAIIYQYSPYSQPLESAVAVNKNIHMGQIIEEQQDYMASGSRFNIKMSSYQ